MVEREYMFYLSFENSLCKDYITEKFYSAMNRSIVPITLGGALEGACNDYVDAAGAPSHSFIDALRDYPDPAKLATYLKTLRTKPSLFAEFFWWKDFYRTGVASNKRKLNFFSLPPYKGKLKITYCSVVVVRKKNFVCFTTRNNPTRLTTLTNDNSEKANQ